MKTIEEINQLKVKKILSEKKIPDFFTGDVVKVGVRITEGKKERIQYFEGICIAKKNESFENGLLEYPQYTKPQIWEKKGVPEVLLSGDHAKIKDWRLSQSEAITRDRRPDLWQKYKKN